MEEVKGIKSFIKDAVESSGQKYSEELANDVLKKYNNNYDSIITDIAKENKVKDVDAFRDDIYSRYDFSPSTPDNTLHASGKPQIKVPELAEKQKQFRYNPRVAMGMPIDEAKQIASNVADENIENRGNWKGFGKELGLQAKSSVNDLTAAIYGTPGFVYDFIGSGFRALNIPVPEWDESLFTKDATVGKRDINPLSILEKDKDILLEASRKNTEEVIKLNPDYIKGVQNAFAEGDVDGGIRNLFSSVMRSAAPSAAMMLTGGMSAPAAMGTTSAVFGSMNLNEADQLGEYGNLSRDGVVAVSALTGAIEYIFERNLGSGAAGNAIKKLITEKGEDVAKQQIKKTWQDQVSNMIIRNPWMAPFGEAYEEIGTQLAQNTVNKFSGYMPDIKITDGVIDAGLMGTTSGGIHMSMIKAIQQGMNASGDAYARNQVKKEYNKSIGLLEDIPDANYTEAVYNLTQNYTDPQELFDTFQEINQSFNVSQEDFLKAYEFVLNSARYTQMSKSRAQQIEEGIKKYSGTDGNVTTATIDDQEWYIKNPEDLGKPGKIIFAHNENGTKAFQSVKVKDWLSQTPDEVRSTTSQEDEMNEQLVQEQELIAEQQQLLTGVDEGAEIVNDQEQGSLRVIEFSNGQSKAIEEGQEIIFNTPEELQGFLKDYADEEIKLQQEQAKANGEPVPVNLDELTPEERYNQLLNDDPEIAGEMLVSDIEEIRTQAEQLRKAETGTKADKLNNLKQAKQLEAEAQRLETLLQPTGEKLAESENNLDNNEAKVNQNENQLIDNQIQQQNKVNQKEQPITEAGEQKQQLSYFEDVKNVSTLAQKIINGEQITDEDKQLQTNFPKELEKELKRQKRLAALQKKANKPQKPRKLSKVRQDAVSLEVYTPREIVLQYLAAHGKINMAALQSVFGNKKGKSVERERRRRISYYSPEGMGVNEMAHMLWENSGDQIYEKYDSQDFREAVEDIILSFNSSTAMAKELLQNYQSIDEQMMAEAEAMQQAEDENDAEIDDLADKAADNIKNNPVIASENEVDNVILQDYESGQGTTESEADPVRGSRSGNVGENTPGSASNANQRTTNENSVEELSDEWKQDNNVPFRADLEITATKQASEDLRNRPNALKALQKLSELFNIKVNIIHSSEMSENVILASKGINGTPKAYYDPNTKEAYIISDMISKDHVSDVKKSFFHEAILHKGLDLIFDLGPITLLGKKYKNKEQFLSEVFKRLDDNTIANRAKIYAPDFFAKSFEFVNGRYQLKKGASYDSLSEAKKQELAEETLAELNEIEDLQKETERLNKINKLKAGNLSTVKTLIDSLWRHIKKLAGWSSKQFTRRDLIYMLAEHRKLVKQATGTKAVSSTFRGKSALAGRGSTRFQAAWHGSPHAFDKFSTQFMGTGEGAQAYGWGLYFTDKRSIAEDYADMDTSRQAGFFDKMFDVLNGFSINGLGLSNVIAAYQDEVLNDLSTNIVGVVSDIRDIAEGRVKSRIWIPNDVIDFILANSDEISRLFKKNRNLYKVKIHGDKTIDELNFIRWDKPLSNETKQAISKQAQKEKIELPATTIPYNFPQDVLDEAVANGADKTKATKAINELYKEPLATKKRNTAGYWTYLGKYVNNIDLNEAFHDRAEHRNIEGSLIYQDLSETIGSDKAASEFLLRAGIDGIQYPTEYTSKGEHEDSFNYVVFDENAVEIEDHIRFRAEQQDNNLIVMHNLDPDNILNIHKLGGLPVPSIAIARTDVPFTSYGSISLIADKSLVDPKGHGKARTFNSDIYSPRYPGIHYDIDFAAFDKVFDEANIRGAEKYGLHPISIGSLGLDTSGLSKLQDDRVAMLAYLIDKGDAPRPVKKSSGLDKSLHKFIKKGHQDAFALRENPEFIEAVTNIYKAIDEELGEEHFVKNGKVNDNLLRNEASRVANTDAVIEPDYHTNRDNIRERATGTPKKREAFNQWIREKFESMVTKERIFKGYTNSGSKRYQPHTLENVVAELRKGLQGEEGMNYGLGSVRSGAAKEFQSIDEIQQDRNQIVPHDEFNKIKEELSNEYSEIMELVKPYYKYATDHWMYSTGVSESLLDYAKKGRSVDFKPMPTEVRKQLNDFMNRLKHMPTEYFESKVQRAVDLSEFKAAIVPNKTPQNVIDILEDKGIKVSKYNPDKEGDRSRKVETASKKNNLRFRVEGSIDKTAEITNPEYWKGKTFGYIHNSQPSENMGSMFGQDVEPAGKYITMDYAFIPANYVEGTVTFNNPLVIDITGQEYPQWKKDLSLLNKGVTGKKLSNKLRQQGYDAIITVEQYKGNYYPSETVILDNEIDSMKGARFRVENLDAKIEQLQNQRERVVAEKNRLIKQANQRNGLFGDTQALQNDMFGGEGFNPQAVLSQEQGFNAQIQRIDNEIALLKKQSATGKIEESGQMTLFRVEPVDVSLFKYGEGGTKGLFQDDNGTLFKSLVGTWRTVENGEVVTKYSKKDTNEYEMLKALQGNPNIPVIGERVITNEGPAFEIEKLEELTSLNYDEYNEIKRILLDLNNQGYFVNDIVSVMKRPKTGELVIVDFSSGFYNEAFKGESYYSDASGIHRLYDMLSVEDQKKVKDDRDRELQRLFGDRKKRMEERRARRKERIEQDDSEVKFRVNDSDAVYSSLLKNIKKGALITYLQENDLSREEINDVMNLNDTYWIDEYLSDTYGISVTEKGFVQFDELTPEVKKIVGNNEIQLYHHTASGILSEIQKNGLQQSDKNVNRNNAENLGVYLTNEYSGPVVDGYKYNAVQAHGGFPLTLEVVTTINQIQPDANDADISSGRKQFVVQGINPEDILNLPDVDTESVRFKVDNAAQETNTNPTEPQKQAGNYKMGHVRFDGFDISIENPKGSIRSGKDKTGREWQHELPADYGYFRGTKGRDKDHIDVFIGPKPENDRIYVVDQIDPTTGNYDEAKVMLGFDNISQARNTYLAAYETGWKGLGEITRTDKAGLKEWFNSEKTTKPFFNSGIRFRSENADELTNYDNSKYDIAELKGKLYYSTSDNQLITSKNIDTYINEKEIAFEEATAGGTHAFFEYLDNVKSTKQLGQFGVKITKDGDKYTFVYDPDKWLRESAKILKPYEYKTNLRNSIRSLYNEIGDFELSIPETNTEKKASEFLHINQGVRFAIRSDNPEVDQLFRQLDKIQRASESRNRIKNLKTEFDQALVFEKPDIQKQIKDLKEGIRLGQKDTKEKIKAIQSAIIQYAQRNMPYDEVGKRDMFAVINKIRDAQTPGTIEKAFDKIDEITKENESNKNIRAVERLIKWMTNFRQKGQNKEGKFTYETVKEFEEFKRIHKEAIAQAAIKNSTKATGKQKAEADKALEAMWQEIEQKESKSLLDLTTMKLIELRRNGKSASKELIQAIREDLQTIYDAAKDAKTAEDIERVIYRKEDRDFVKQFLDGKPIQDRKRLDRWMAETNEFLANSMGNWETILTMMGGYKLRDKFSLILNQVEMEVNTQETFNEVMETAMNGYGLKDKKALQSKLNEMKKKEYSIVKPIREGDRGEGSDIPLSKLMLIDIYNAIQNEKIREDYYFSYGDIVTNPDDGRPNEILQRRIGKERIDKLMENLNEGDIIFAKAMQQAAESYWGKMNDVFIRTFNRDLPKRDNYWPSTAEFQNMNDAFEQSKQDSLHPSSTKELATRRTPLIADAFEKFARHIKDGEWYTNMAIPVTRLNNIFKNPNVKDLITDKYGEDFHELINKHLAHQGLRPPVQSLLKIEKAANWLLDNWIVSAIGLTVTVPAKQLLSVVNYTENMPPLKWATGFIKAMANPAKTWKEMMETVPYLKVRLGTGYSEAVQNALNSDKGTSKASSIHKSIKKWLTIGTRYGDIAAIIFGGKPYLDYLLSTGMDQKEAVDQFLLDTLRSQQAPFSSTLSLFQNSKTPWKRAMFAFSNTPSQYNRKLIEGHQAYKRGDISAYQWGKVISIYGIINNITWVAAGMFFSNLLSGRDDWDEFEKSLGLQIAISLVGGLPGIKDAVDLGGRLLTGLHVYESMNPIYEGPFEFADNIDKAIRTDDIDKTKTYLLEAAKYGSSMIGIGGRNVEKIYKATIKRAETMAKADEYEVNDKLKELSEPKKKIDAELKGMSNYYKKTRKNKPDYKAAETAHELKYAYSSAKSKATKLEGEGKKAQAERLREAVIRSKANLNDSDYTLRDIEQELKRFNSRVELIID